MTKQPLPTPHRIQLSRRKGWRMPPDTVLVARPSRWGNPFSLIELGRERAIALYREHLQELLATQSIDLSPLRGKNLACWCALDLPCHADVLLDFANRREVAVQLGDTDDSQG
jgi:hypothetical protein